jgi:hypothetical protein
MHLCGVSWFALNRLQKHIEVQNMNNMSHRGVKDSYRFGNVHNIPENVQTIDQLPVYEEKQVQVPVKFPVAVKHDIAAINRLDSAFRAISGVAKKRNTQAEIKELAKLLPVADLIWDQLYMIVTNTITTCDDPVFCDSLALFAEELGSAKDKAPAQIALDVWNEHTTTFSREITMRNKAIILMLVQQQLSKV